MKLVFLGKLADLAGCAEREVDVDEVLDWERMLALFDEALAGELRSERVKVAVDGRVLADKDSLVAGPDDEVAFLPPVSGG